MVTFFAAKLPCTPHFYLQEFSMKTAKVLSLMFLTFLLLASTSVFAQTEKGEFLIDVDFLLDITGTELDDANDTEVDNTEFEFDVQVGYLVIDNLEVGGMLTVKTRSTDIKNEFFDSETSEDMFLIGPFARYFFMPDSQLKPFVGANIFFGTDNEEAGGAKTEMSVLGYGLAGGVVYFINEHWGIEGMYRLNKIDHTNDDASDMSSLANSITIGVVYGF